MAWRNTRRNTRRSALTVAAVALGAAALVLLAGYVEHAFWGLRESTIRNHLGHLRVHRPAASPGGAPAPRLDAAETAAARQALAALPGVDAIVGRVELDGLIAAGERTAPFVGRGIEPEREGSVPRLATLVAGGPLVDGRDRGVLVGRGLAATLGVVPGARATLLALTADGRLNGLEADIVGVIETGAVEFDGRAVIMALALAQELLAGARVDAVVAFLARTDATPEALAGTRARLAAADGGLVVTPWWELATFYQRVVALYGALFRFVAAIVLALVALGVANTVAMAVLERQREAGTLAALGAGRGRLAGMFVLEGALLGALGGVLGALAGAGLCLLVDALGGIPVPPPPGASRGYLVRPMVVPWALGGSVALAVVMGLAGSVAPAVRAARARPAEALRSP